MFSHQLYLELFCGGIQDTLRLMALGALSWTPGFLNVFSVYSLFMVAPLQCLLL